MEQIAQKTGSQILVGNTLEKFLTYQLDGRIGAYHGDNG